MSISIKNSSKFKAFSYPVLPLDESLLEVLTILHAKEIVNILLTDHRTKIESNSDGITDILVSFLNDEALSYNIAWHSSLGNILDALIYEKPFDECLIATVSFIFWLHSNGLERNWQIVLNSSKKFSWGRWLLPSANRIEVEFNNTNAIVSLYNKEKKYELYPQMTKTGWEIEGAKKLPMLIYEDQKIIFLPVDALIDFNIEELQPVLTEKETLELVDSMQKALSLLHRISPIYVEWVIRVIRYIIPLKGIGNNMRSGSFFNHYGVIKLSLNDQLVPLMEMLVHEASHQYYNIISWLGPLDDGTDTNYYYSPVVNKPRPLKKILLAFHAFANVFHLYNLCLEKGVEDNGYSYNNKLDLIPQLEQLLKPLTNNKSLTSLGKALSEPLINSILPVIKQPRLHEKKKKDI